MITVVLCTSHNSNPWRYINAVSPWLILVNAMQNAMQNNIPSQFIKSFAIWTCHLGAWNWSWILNFPWVWTWPVTMIVKIHILVNSLDCMTTVLPISATCRCGYSDKMIRLFDSISDIQIFTIAWKSLIFLKILKKDYRDYRNLINLLDRFFGAMPTTYQAIWYKPRFVT